MKKTLLFVLALALAGCASVKKIEPGSRTLGERFTVNIQGNWNHLDFPGIKPAQVWTMEGVTVDELMLYSGIRDGQAMQSGGGAQKKELVFRSAMQIEEVVSLFEGVLTQDGSTFKLLRLDPYAFAGRKGYRFEYERIRKYDNVHQQGIGFGTIDRGELFALVYHAPRQTFFPRHKARVEAIAASAGIN